MRLLKREAAMWWWSDYWPMPWAFGPLMMIAVIVVCGAMMFFMMRGMMGSHRGRNGVALDILKERFARGEITETEYEERRRRIEA
jgi:putative membrane protein